MIDKIIAKFLPFLLLLLCFVGFRETIQTDKTLANAVLDMLKALPFERLISHFAYKKFLDSQQTLQNLDIYYFVYELSRLAVMSILQMRAGIWLSVLFLGRPSEDEQEKMWYKIKEFMVFTVTVPLLALLAAKITDELFAYIVKHCGTIIPLVLGGATILLFSFVYVKTLVVGFALALGASMTWCFVKLLMGMLKTFLICIIFYFLCFAFLTNAFDKFWEPFCALLALLGVVQLFTTSAREALFGGRRKKKK